MRKEKLFAMILLGLAAGLVSLGTLPLFQLKTIQVQGNQNMTIKEVENKLSEFKGSSLFQLSTPKISSRLRSDKRIENVKLRLDLPGSLQVGILEKEAVMVMEGNRVWGISEEGEILPFNPATDSTLPRIRGIKTTNLKPYAKPVVPLLNKVMELYLAAREKSPAILELVKAIEVDRWNNLSLELFPGETKVYLGSEGYEVKLARLVEILTTEMTPLASIDLRFSNLGLVQYKS